MATKNILLCFDQKGQPSIAKIADFGLSREVYDVNSFDLYSVVGTKFYQAPELASRESFDGRVDIWALGIIFYRMLYASYPFFGSNVVELQKNVQSQPVFFPPFTVVRDEIKKFIALLLEKDKALRPKFDEVYKMFQDLKKTIICPPLPDPIVTPKKPVISTEFSRICSILDFYAFVLSEISSKYLTGVLTLRADLKTSLEKVIKKLYEDKAQEISKALTAQGSIEGLPEEKAQEFQIYKASPEALKVFKIVDDILQIEFSPQTLKNIKEEIAKFFTDFHIFRKNFIGVVGIESLKPDCLYCFFLICLCDPGLNFPYKFFTENEISSLDEFKKKFLPGTLTKDNYTKFCFNAKLSL